MVGSPSPSSLPSPYHHRRRRCCQLCRYCRHRRRCCRCRRNTCCLHRCSCCRLHHCSTRRRRRRHRRTHCCRPCRCRTRHRRRTRCHRHTRCHCHRRPHRRHRHHLRRCPHRHRRPSSPTSPTPLNAQPRPIKAPSPLVRWRLSSRLPLVHRLVVALPVVTCLHHALRCSQAGRCHRSESIALRWTLGSNLRCRQHLSLLPGDRSEGRDMQQRSLGCLRRCDGGWRQPWLAVVAGGAAMASSAGGDKKEGQLQSISVFVTHDHQGGKNYANFANTTASHTACIMG